MKKLYWPGIELKLSHQNLCGAPSGNEEKDNIIDDAIGAKCAVRESLRDMPGETKKVLSPCIPIVDALIDSTYEFYVEIDAMRFAFQNEFGRICEIKNEHAELNELVQKLDFSLLPSNVK